MILSAKNYSYPRLSLPSPPDNISAAEGNKKGGDKFLFQRFRACDLNSHEKNLASGNLEPFKRD